MTHQDRVRAAEDALRAVFSDTSVEPSETLRSLSELKSEIRACELAIREDIRADRAIDRARGA